MAITPVRPAAPVQTVTVHLGSAKIADLDSVSKIVASALGKLGCPGCFSGFDIRFSHLQDLVVNPRTLEVGDLHVGG